MRLVKQLAFLLALMLIGVALLAAACEREGPIERTPGTATSVEEPHSQPLLQAGHAFAHERPRQAELIGGGSEAAALHHAHEHRDVRQVFHGQHLSIIANNL
jgi:hypothetical protein